MKKLALVLLLFSLGAVRAHSSIAALVLNINGFTCTDFTATGATPGVGVASWTWGTTDPFSGSNGGTVTPGRISLNIFNVARKTDFCSSALMALSLQGTVSSTVTLTEYDYGGSPQAPVVESVVVTLTNAVLVSYQLGGNRGVNPQEQLSFAFTRICLADHTNGASTCYTAPIILR